MKVRIKKGYIDIVKIQGLDIRKKKYNCDLSIKDGDIVEVRPFKDGKLISNGFKLVNPKTKLDELSVFYREDFDIVEDK